MINCKTAEPSGVVAEIMKPAPDICCRIIADLMNAIIHEGKVPEDWSDSITVRLFKGKKDEGDALDWNNYGRLELTDHVLKVINIDEM